MCRALSKCCYWTLCQVLCKYDYWTLGVKLKARLRHISQDGVYGLTDFDKGWEGKLCYQQICRSQQ